jgi:hypothetical protein
MSLVRWAMNNDGLEEQGLPSLEKQWCSIRYPNGPKGSKEEQVVNWNRRATDPYGRWCGGWRLESPGYPILHLVHLSEAVEIVAVEFPENAFVRIQID